MLPLSTRSLDPATETWSARTHVFDSVGGFVFEHDSAGNLLMLAGPEVAMSVIQPGIQWTRYDSVARTWAATAELDPVASLVRSRVMASPSGTTYLWAWPVDDAGPQTGWMRSFDGTSWTLLEGSGPVRPAAIEIDQHGNLLATWAGPLETPGQFAQWYDAATQTWGEVERLDVPGVSTPYEQPSFEPSSIAFDAEGNALVYWVGADINANGWVRTRSAQTGTWTEPEPVVSLSGRIFADPRGQVHIAGNHCVRSWIGDSLESDCSAGVARYDATTKEWHHRVLMEHIGLGMPEVHLENGEALFRWEYNQETTSPDPVWTSQLGPDGEWSEPTEVPTADWVSAAMKLGAEGRAIVVWPEVSSDPGPVPLRLLASRYERATGWGAPEVVYEPSGDPMFTQAPEVALDSRGYATVVWGMEDGDEFDPGLLQDEIRVSRWACRPTAE